MSRPGEDIYDEFNAFYRELHAYLSPPSAGHQPTQAYLWQRRAAAALTAGEAFDVLDVPTGCGKTTMIECFLFALAWQAREHGERSLPLRLFWVVDRRSVVDQVFAHAKAVQRGIIDSDGDKVSWVRDSLASIGVTDGQESDSVQVQRWRGGTGFRPEPISPTTPAVICSTVDQVGSRMLFRGYGVSRRSRPIDAALVGTDSLIVLDEAHISAPFLQTAESIASAQRRATVAPARPLRLIRSTATPPPDSDGEVFSLTDEERSEPEIERRVSATKLCGLISGNNLPEALITQARALARTVDGVIGVVANTVADARTVFEELRKHAPATLIIGPNRPIDRQLLLAEIPERDQSQEPRAQLFVVSTQTLEVGLDLDFDGMVTAAAPFSALAQRLGRLDRAGRIRESRAVVVNSKKCPVYGPLAGATWDWLFDRAENGAIDLGPNAIQSLLQDQPPPVGEPITPRLMDWHLEALTQTSDNPVPDPDIGVFLHGEPALDTADVQIAWRQDLVGDPTSDKALQQEWQERIAMRLPHPDELLQVRIGQARRWLAGKTAQPFSDLETEGQADEVAPERGPSATASFVIVPPRNADKRVEPVWTEDLTDLRPGAVIVAPADRGGCDRFGWSPESSTAVDDLGDLDPSHPRLLIDASQTLATDTDLKLQTAIAYFEAELDAYDLLADHARQLLSRRGDDSRRALWRELAEAFPGAGGAVIPVPAAAPTGLILIPNRATRSRNQQHDEQSYERHIRMVVANATRFASVLTTDRGLRGTIVFAAEYHDAGKLDPRFQAWLNGGSVNDGSEPLAKSSVPLNSAASRAAQLAAGWPHGMRHETISAALVEAAGRNAVPPEVDVDLALHLILTHHGQHRPFYPSRRESSRADPVTTKVAGQEVSVSPESEPPWGEHVARFWALNEAYSPWGLAALESALVLADRIASRDASTAADGE